MNPEARSVVIRLAEPSDVEGLVELARTGGHGFTSLPPNVAQIEARLQASIAGDEPLLVMLAAKDVPSVNRVIGCAGLVRSTGRPEDAEPFYAYRIERSIHQSQRLGVRNEVATLHLSAEYDGSTLIGSLLLAPAWRGRGLGRLLSLSRFMLLARHADQFKPSVVAELRGPITPQGQSPFWEAIGRHFFHVDYTTADRLSAEDKRFIAELMPRHPIYLPLLPRSARDVVGQVHPDTHPAMRLLESEGFYRTSLIDIFDAGPVMRCDVRAIRTVRRAQRVTLAPLSGNGGLLPGEAGLHLILVDHPRLRIIGAPAVLDGTRTLVSPSVLEQLQVSSTAEALVAPLRDAPVSPEKP